MCQFFVFSFSLFACEVQGGFFRARETGRTIQKRVYPYSVVTSLVMVQQLASRAKF